MASNFKGVLVYTKSGESYTSSNITSIAGSGASNISDYVILDISDTNHTTIANQIFKVAKQIYNKKPSARLWLATPSYSSSNALTYNQIKTYLTNLKALFINDSVGKNVWQNAVKGIYMNMEAIYGSVDYSSSSSLLNNSSIKVANDVSYFVHNTLESKGTLEFLWIPYYGYNSNAATIIKNIGYVTARTNIFDIVIIQPAYYFYYLTNTVSNGKYSNIKSDSDSVLAANLTGVKYSVSKNNVCYRDGVEVISRSNWTATIGFEMELDNSNSAQDPYYDQSRKSKQTRYNEYVNTFMGLRNKPMCYYAGGKDSLIARISKINNFYSGTTDTSRLYI